MRSGMPGLSLPFLIIIGIIIGSIIGCAPADPARGKTATGGQAMSAGGSGGSSGVGGTGSAGGSVGTGGTGGSSSSGGSGSSGGTVASVGGSGDGGSGGSGGSAGGSGGSGDAASDGRLAKDASDGGSAGAGGGGGTNGGSGGTTVPTGGATGTGGKGGTGGTSAMGGSSGAGGSTGPTACSFPSAWAPGSPTYTTYSLPNPATACGYTGSNNSITNIAVAANYAAIPGQSPSNFDTSSRCGACVQIGSAVITIVDECPYDAASNNQPCANNPKGHLDLSTTGAGAAGVKGDPALTNQSAWKFIPCPINGNVVVRLKNGNNNEIYIENEILPIQSVTCAGQTGSRTSYGAWHFSSNIPGASCDVTDIAGRMISVTAGSSQGQNVDTGKQFPKCQ